MEQLTTYILGPMRKIPLYNFPAFDAAAKILLAEGHTVVNPAQLDRQVGFDPRSLPENHDWSQMPASLDLDDVITRDVAALRKCNAYFTLDGWETSIGAKAEKALLDWQGARWLNPKTAEAFPEAPRGAAALALAAAQAQSLPGRGGAPTRETTLPEDAQARKTYPVASGFLDYFPDAVVAIAHVSWKGNQQHNAGQPLFWNRGKSGDEADALMRHFLRRGTIDTDGIPHSAKLAWRALALLQKELESPVSVDGQQRAA